MIYFFTFLILFFFFIHFDVRGKRKYGNFFYFFSYIVLVSIAAFRYRVGGDSLGYFDEYSSYPTMSDIFTTDFSSMRYQPLFYLFAAVCKLFGDNFFYFQLFHAIFINLIIFLFLKRYSQYKFAAILLYYLLYYLYFNMEILRESLSVCIFLIAVQYLINKSYIRYYILIIIAYFLHSSAIFLFVLPVFVYFLNKNKLYFILLLLGVIILYMYVISNRKDILHIIPPKLALKMFGYISRDLTSIGTMAIYLLKGLGLSLFLWVEKGNPVKKNIFVPFIWIGLLVFLLSPIIYGFNRIINYFSIIIIVFIINTFSLVPIIKRKVNQISTFSLSFALFIFLSLQCKYLTNDTSRFVPNTRFYNRYFPYESIFSGESHYNRENIYYNTLKFYHDTSPDDIY